MATAVDRRDRLVGTHPIDRAAARAPDRRRRPRRDVRRAAEVGFRLGGAATTFSTIRARRHGPHLSHRRAHDEPRRHQMVRRAADRRRRAGPRPTAPAAPATRSPTSTARRRRPTRSRAAAARRPNGTALVVATVKSATGPPPTWSVSRASRRPACWTRRSAPPARARRTSRPRTSSTRPRSSRSRTAASSSAARSRRLHLAVRARRLPRGRQRRHDAQPGQHAAANAANLQVGTGGVDRILALAVTPQGRLLAAGESQTPSETDLSAIVRLGGDAHSPQASFTVTWEQAVPGRAVRPGQTVGFDGSASTDPDGPIVKYEWDIDGDGSLRAHRRQGARQLPRPDRRRRAPARHRRRRPDRTPPARRSTSKPTRRRRSLHQPRQAAGRGRALHLRRAGRGPRRHRRRLRLRPRRQRHLRDRPARSRCVTTTFVQKGPATVGVRVTDDEGATRPRQARRHGQGRALRRQPDDQDRARGDRHPGRRRRGRRRLLPRRHHRQGRRPHHHLHHDRALPRQRPRGRHARHLRGEARVEAQARRRRQGDDLAQAHRRAKAKVEGTGEKTDFMFHEGSINWDLDGRPRSAASSSTRTPVSAACR